MDEQEVNILGVKIIYKFKPPKYDCNHLLVVFSGFGSSSEFTYDFENLLQISNASVLWIKDDFILMGIVAIIYVKIWILLLKSQ